MEINKSISPRSNIALDTNIFIYAMQSSGEKGESARALFEKIAKEKPRVSISVLVFEDFLSGAELFTVIDITRAICRIAAKIRANHKSIRTTDAFHIACARASGARTFITADKRLPEKIEGVTVTVL